MLDYLNLTSHKIKVVTFLLIWQRHGSGSCFLVSESRPDLRDVIHLSSQPRKEDCDSMLPRDCLLDKLNGCYCLHVRTHRWSTPWWGPNRRRRRRARRQWRSCRRRMSLPWEHGLRTPRSTTLESKVQSENLRQPKRTNKQTPPPSLTIHTVQSGKYLRSWEPCWLVWWQALPSNVTLRQRKFCKVGKNRTQT